jgi:hypothetical protein
MMSTARGHLNESKVCLEQKRSTLARWCLDDAVKVMGELRLAQLAITEAGKVSWKVPCRLLWNRLFHRS